MKTIAIMPNLLDVLSPFGPHKIRSGVSLSCGIEQFNEVFPTSGLAFKGTQGPTSKWKN